MENSFDFEDEIQREHPNVFWLGFDFHLHIWSVQSLSLHMFSICMQHVIIFQLHTGLLFRSAKIQVQRRFNSTMTTERPKLFCAWFCPFAQRAWISLEHKVRATLIRLTSRTNQSWCWLMCHPNDMPSSPCKPPLVCYPFGKERIENEAFWSADPGVAFGYWLSGPKNWKKAKTDTKHHTVTCIPLGKKRKKEEGRSGRLLGWGWRNKKNQSINLISQYVPRKRGNYWAHPSLFLLLFFQGIDFEYVEQSPYEKTPEWLSINPRGLVPTIQYKSHTVYESPICIEFTGI